VGEAERPAESATGTDYRRREPVRIAPLCQAVPINTTVASRNTAQEPVAQPTRAAMATAPWTAATLSLARADTGYLLLFG
jgi:hypothetical protein